MDINLYDSNVGKIEFGKIYRLTNLRKACIKKDEETKTRLFTTKFTKIMEASPNEKILFENVNIAKNQLHGIILGHSEVNCYKSCEKHWNKLDKEEICPKCEGIPKKIRIDFNTDLYIQDSSTEDIKSFLIFKRQMKMITFEDSEDEIKVKMEEIEGKKCTIDFDGPTNEDEKIIPKRVTVH